jgi:hypothetical protein
MHDPVRQTSQWLKSIVQGHFNYYAVPGKHRQSQRIQESINWALVAYTSPPKSETPASPGHVCSRWLTDGSLDRAYSILIPQIASPPVIHSSTIRTGCANDYYNERPSGSARGGTT